MSSLNSKNIKKHKDKGNWRYSFFQQKQTYDNAEQNIKNDMKPENSFDPSKVNNYINPVKSKEELMETRIKNGEKLKKVEQMQYDNYVNKNNEILKEDLKKIEIIKLRGKGELPETSEGKLRLLLTLLSKYIKANNTELICNFYLKIMKENFTITPAIHKDNLEDLEFMEKVINSQDLIELQFTKFYDTMPPLNENGFKKFDPWQIDVIKNIDENISTIVSAPTSAGKTVLAGYAATKGRTMFIAPTDALCWQIASYVGNFLNTDVPIVTTTYNSIPNDKCQCKLKKNKKLNLSCALCVRSPREKIIENLNNSIAIVGTPDALLDYIPLINSNFDWIVMDEIHMIGKEEGSSMELIAKVFNNVKFLALSATIGNLNEITEWFQKLNTERPVKNIVCDKRFFNLQRFYYNPTENAINILHPLALVNITDFENGTILKKNLMATPVDTWLLYSKMKEYYDLNDLDHKNYFKNREIVHLDKANKYLFDLIKFMVDNYDVNKITSIVNSFKNINLGEDKVNLVKLAFKLKEEKKTPAIIFQKNTLACLRMGRSFAKDIEKMEDDEFPNLYKDRCDVHKEARRMQKSIEKDNKDEKSIIKNSVVVDKKGNVQIKERKDMKKDKNIERITDKINEKGSDNKKSINMKDKMNKEESFNELNIEDLYQPHEKYILNNYQYFKDEQIKVLVDDLKKWFPYSGGQYHFIIRLLWRGVGIYTKGLPDPYLRLVQKLTSEKKLAILFSDMSLVFGVSMPFKTSVIYRDPHVVDDLDAMLYHQMAGRAGRRGLDKEGNVVFAEYSSERIEQLSICPIPNVDGINKINLVIPQANKISEIIGNKLDWDKVFKNPLDKDSDENEQLEILEGLKTNFDNGWKFAYKQDDINHLIMMWSLRNAENEEPIIIAYMLPYIKKGFESMDFDNQLSQITLAHFLCNFISIKIATFDENKLSKCPVFNEESYAQIFSDFDKLQININMNTKIDNSICESIRFNKIIKTTEKETNELRERLLEFAQKIISIQHYFFETKTTNLAKLFAKLLTRIWWIYHTSSPLMKPFNSFDEEEESIEYISESDSSSSEE